MGTVRRTTTTDDERASVRDRYERCRVRGAVAGAAHCLNRLTNTHTHTVSQAGPCGVGGLFFILAPSCAARSMADGTMTTACTLCAGLWRSLARARQTRAVREGQLKQIVFDIYFFSFLQTASINYVSHPLQFCEMQWIGLLEYFY